MRNRQTAAEITIKTAAAINTCHAASESPGCGYNGRQPRRPDHLPQVHRVRPNRGRDACPERNFGGGPHRASGLLRLHRDHGAGSGEREQRQFLKHESRPGKCGKRLARFRVRSAHSRQRPVIEQQQYERQRDHHWLRGKSRRKQSGHRQIALPVRLSRIPAVGPEREEEKHRAQDILALSHPGHRLDIDGMKREQRRHEQARPQPLRGPHQQQKKQGHIHHMQQDAGEMVARGIQAEQRTIEGMRHPGERMPVRLFGRSQRPGESVRRQTLPDVRIVDDVTVVIVVREGMTIDRIVERERDHGEKQAHDGIALLGRRKQASLAFGRQQ